MLKIIGASVILTSCISIGFMKSLRMRKRCENLSALIAATERIGAEISFSKMRLERIFNEAARDFNLPVFSDAAFMMLRLGTKSAIIRSLKKYADDMALTENDLKAAKNLGAIGDFAGDEQQRCITTTIKLLELSLAEAKDNYNKGGKLYRSCGILFGLLGVILLF
ncbi:MAG: stage III sporulation protein AB [Eubacteriales bacterium]|nr:stage III sporulation protein AB [Eubacteriales bacterium]